MVQAKEGDAHGDAHEVVEPSVMLLGEQSPRTTS